MTKAAFWTKAQSLVLFLILLGLKRISQELGTVLRSAMRNSSRHIDSAVTRKELERKLVKG